MSFKARVAAIAGNIGVFINISLDGIRGYFASYTLQAMFSTLVLHCHARMNIVHSYTLVIWDGQKAGGTEHGTLYSPEALLAD